MADQQDFFGVNMLSADPQAAKVQNMANVLSAVQKNYAQPTAGTQGNARDAGLAQDVMKQQGITRDSMMREQMGTSKTLDYRPFNSGSSYGGVPPPGQGTWDPAAMHNQAAMVQGWNANDPTDFRNQATKRPYAPPAGGPQPGGGVGMFVPQQVPTYYTPQASGDGNEPDTGVPGPGEGNGPGPPGGGSGGGGGCAQYPPGSDAWRRCYGVPEEGITNPNYGSGGGGGGVNTSGIPNDLVQLREHLQNWSLDYLNNPGSSPQIPFEWTQLQGDPSWGKYGQIMEGGLAQSQAGQMGAYNQLMGMAGSGPNYNQLAQPWAYGSNAMEALTATAANPESFFSQGREQQYQGSPYSMNMQQLAGGNMQNLNPALQAIQQQSMGQIEDQLAQIREQYGARGLGAGTDVAEALSRGASRGIADMNAQMQGLTAQYTDADANRRMQASQYGMQGMTDWNQMWQGGRNQQLNALGMMGQQAQGMLGTGGNIINQGYGLQTQAAQGAGQIAGQYGSNLAAMAPGLAAYPTMAQNLQQGNYERLTDEIIRRASGPPALANIMNYASAVPAQQFQPRQQSPWPGILGGLGGAAMGMFSFSDRGMKEDIRPVRTRVSRALRRLPISTWRYKGDDTRHIGPMAQDFQKQFGVGDGKRIHLVDVMGVLLSSMKDLIAAPIKKPCGCKDKKPGAKPCGCKDHKHPDLEMVHA
jgi:hypothetical protein